MNRNLFLLAAICFFYSCASSKDSFSKKPILSIDFQEGFSDNNVSFNVNNCVVFSNKKLTTDSVLGSTKSRVTIYANKNGMDSIVEEKNHILCKGEEKYLLFVAQYSKIDTVQIEPKKGRYIGISSGLGKIYFTQSKKPFVYY